MGLRLLEIDQSVQGDGVYRCGKDVVELLAVVIEHDGGRDGALVREPVRRAVNPAVLLLLAQKRDCPAAATSPEALAHSPCWA